MFAYVRTQNPRPTFHLDMTDDEKRLMLAHVAYWSSKPEAVVFGPVLDPKGVYGIGVYQVDDLHHMQRLLDGDPAKGLLKYELFEMPRAVLGAAAGR